MSKGATTRFATPLVWWPTTTICNQQNLSQSFSAAKIFQDLPPPRDPYSAWLPAAKAQAMLAPSQNSFEIRPHSVRNAD
jgi:hypothetical protein